jgi:hypothetical protein
VLVIRKEQLEAFRQSLTEDLRRRLVAHLRSACPAETAALTDEALAGLVDAERTRAREFAIVSEPDLRRYLEFALAHGSAFDMQPETAWAGEILRRRDLEGHEKLNLLDEHQLFSDRGRP